MTLSRGSETYFDVVTFGPHHHVHVHKCRAQQTMTALAQRQPTVVARKSKMTYGKLVERILTFRRMGVSFAPDLVPLADARLEDLKSFWTGQQQLEEEGSAKRMAVFGDASASMQTAIEAASIFASMVSVCFDAELSFFGADLVPSPHEKPQNVHEALEVSTKVRAAGGTSLAAALWPYYANRKKMDMFIMVTDEGENTKKEGYMFAPLLKKYRDEINPDVKLVVVRVGRGCIHFQNSLKVNEIAHKTVIVDGERPDHAKFDALLGQLALMASRKVIGDDDVILIDHDDDESKTATGDSNSETDDFVVV